MPLPLLQPLQRLRVDVDDGVDAGLAHRRGGGGEQLPCPGCEGSRAVCLGNELRAVPSAQPEQRRGTEELGSVEPSIQLAQQAFRRGRVGA